MLFKTDPFSRNPNKSLTHNLQFLIMPKHYYATGIISKSRKLGESDRIFHLITKEHGLVRAVAKGVRKPKSKLKGHLQTLNQVNAYIRSGKNLDLITQVESINSFDSIKKDLMLIAEACYMTELTESVITELQPNPELFDLLVSSLKLIQLQKRKSLLIHCFEFQLLNLSGFKLMFLECVNCENQITKESHVFSPTQGGIICPVCKTLESTNLIKLNVNTLKILRNMSTENFSQLLKLTPPKTVLFELSRIFDQTIVTLLGVNLNSLKFYRKIVDN